MQARREGLRVTLDNFRAQPAKTAAAAGQNTTRASHETRAGRFSMTVFDATGKENLNAGVNREDAQRLLDAGAEFIGLAWRAP